MFLGALSSYGVRSKFEEHEKDVRVAQCDRGESLKLAKKKTRCVEKPPSVPYAFGKALCNAYAMLRSVNIRQGWRSGESARLPPMCPGFDSWLAQW